MADTTVTGSIGLTCMTCHVVFADSSLQREHYKCDWHRYNLKRKGAELPPITFELFTKKQTQQNATDSAKQSVEGTRCLLCNKSFKSKQTLLTHCESKKHIENSAKNPESAAICESRSSVETSTKENEVVMEDDGGSDWSDVDSEADEGVPVGNCLFCEQHFKDSTKCVSHMLRTHGFFIPDVEYCVDLEGLLHYLGYKVGAHFVCLWCNERGRQFQSLDAVQKHMVDKQHCKMQHDHAKHVIEYADFYDYSSSYPDAENADAETEAPADVLLEDSNWQLQLPSGATIGHRSLARYFKQRLNPERTLALQRSMATRQTMNSGVLMEYRNASGWLATTGEAARRKQRDLKFMHKLYNKKRMQLGVSHNYLKLDRGRADQS